MLRILLRIFSILPALIVFAALSLSCSTTHLESHLEDWSQKQTAQQKEWVDKYKLGKSLMGMAPQQSCELFAALAVQKDFILVDLAIERARTTCDHLETLPPVSKDWVDARPWLQSIDVERQLHEAELSKDARLIANALVERSKLSTFAKEKIDFLNRAIEQAKLTQDQALLSNIYERYYRLAPRLNPAPNKKDWMRVAQDYVMQRSFSQARIYFKRILVDKEFSLDDKYQALKQVRNSYKLEQNKSEHLKSAKELVSWLKKSQRGDENRLNEAYTVLARAHWTEGNVSAARSTLQLAAHDLHSKGAIDDINLIFGKIAEEAHDNRGALRFYQLANDQGRESHASQEKVLFAQAWVLRKLGEFEAAAVKFAELERVADEGYTKFKYRFWQAMSWSQAGESEVSERLFKGLTVEDPLGFYGLISYYKLNQPIPALKSNMGIAFEPSPALPLDLTLQRRLRAMALVDERDVLSRLISSNVPQLRNPTSMNQDALLFIFKTQAEAGLYQPLFNQLALLDTGTKNKLLEEHPELLFPRRYLDLIEPNAKKFGIEPEFALSIIRQESSFDTMARSSADAFGLMQLLPSAAQAQEKNTKIHLQHHEDLYLPEVNIPDGVSLLAQLSKKYHGQLILTSAAYNASEKAIATWLKTRLREDPLEFIEDIPYEETRAYVKLVLRNYVFYHRMNKVGEPLAFPRHCLEDLQTNRDSLAGASVSN